MKEFVPILIEKTPNSAIIVADNGSDDGSIEWLESHYSPSTVQIIKFTQNWGFTGGYNRAIKEIEGAGQQFEFYLLLNSDVEVTQGWLQTMEQFMDSHPDAAIAAPKVLSYYKRNYFEYAGACGGFLSKLWIPYCRGRILNKMEEDKGQYDDPIEIFWASGTSFMIRSAVWKELGGLDERFFAHMEEIDLCWRAKRGGWQVWVIPQAKIYHVGGGTLPQQSPKKLYYNFRNNLLMMHNNIEKGRNLKIFFRMCIDGAISMVYLITGKWSYFRAVVEAHRDFKSIIKKG